MADRRNSIGQLKIDESILLNGIHAGCAMNMPPRKPVMPLVSLDEIRSRVSALRLQASKTSPGRERDALEAEIALLNNLYENKRATEPEAAPNA